MKSHNTKLPGIDINEEEHTLTMFWSYDNAYAEITFLPEEEKIEWFTKNRETKESDGSDESADCVPARFWQFIIDNFKTED